MGVTGYCKTYHDRVGDEGFEWDTHGCGIVLCGSCRSVCALSMDIDEVEDGGSGLSAHGPVLDGSSPGDVLSSWRAGGRRGSQITHSLCTRCDCIFGVAYTPSSHENIRARVRTCYTRDTTDIGSRS